MTQLPINAANTAALLDESMDDSLALRRFATQGDPTAFRALTQRYQSMVFATCRRVLRSQADAEDAAQETFLKFARAAATIRGNAAAWLHACALGTATDLLRRKTTRERIERAAADNATLTDDQRTWKELEPLLDAALAQLPDEDRDVIVAHFLAGRPQKDLAREAGVAPGTMSRRIDTALAALSQTLKSSSPALLGAATLAAALTCGAKSAVASPALTVSLAKVGLLDAALSGKSAATASTSIFTAKSLLVGAAALVALTGVVGFLSVSVSSKSLPVAIATTAIAQTPTETYTSVPKPTKQSAAFPMNTQKLADKNVDVFEIKVDATKFTVLGSTNEKGERATVTGDRMADLDKKPDEDGDKGTFNVRITRFDRIPEDRSPDPTGKITTLSYTIKNGLMRGKMTTEGAEFGDDNMVWRRDPVGSAAPDPADPIAGSWIQVPTWWSLRFQEDSIELCGGEERWVMARFRIISWDEADGYSKVQTICVDNYVSKSLIGKRMKMLVRKTADDTYQVARWEADSPNVNEWPTFTPKPTDKIRIATFVKEIK